MTTNYEKQLNHYVPCLAAHVHILAVCQHLSHHGRPFPETETMHGQCLHLYNTICQTILSNMLNHSQCTR